jgi:hypothetical protein
MRILIFKALTARSLYTSFGVKGLKLVLWDLEHLYIGTDVLYKLSASVFRDVFFDYFENRGNKLLQPSVVNCKSMCRYILESSIFVKVTKLISKCRCDLTAGRCYWNVRSFFKTDMKCE